MKLKNDGAQIIAMNGADDYLRLDDECSYRTDDPIKKKFPIPVIIFLVIFAGGIVLAAFGEQISNALVAKFGEDLPDFGKIFMIALSAVVLGIANLACFANLVTYLRLRAKIKRCTDEIEATTVMVKIRYERTGKHGRRRVFFPVYSYYYCGKYYIAESDDEDFDLRISRDPENRLGQPRNIAIDPNDPYTLNTNTSNGISMIKLISCILPVAIILPMTVFVISFMMKAF